MKFFTKMRIKTAIDKTMPIGLFFPLMSVCMLSIFISSVSDGAPMLSGLLTALVCLGIYAVILVCLRNNNEYRELIRQAELIGDLDAVGKTIEGLRRIPTKGGVLKANESLIFYTDSICTRIIVPSKITSISESSHFFKCMRYHVNISYLYENHICIEMRSKESAIKLCEELKKTVAPHLSLRSALDD